MSLLKGQSKLCSRHSQASRFVRCRVAIAPAGIQRPTHPSPCWTWQRDFFTVHFKEAKARESTSFSCMLRATGDACAQISPLSGVAALYIEARSPDGKTQDTNFHTTRLSKSTFEEARAFQTTVTCDSSLVRVSNRYGLRVLASDAKVVHHMIRPEVPFLGGTAIPYGTTREGLVKLFQGWEWGGKSGLRWQVVSNTPPPNYVYTLAHGDVLTVKAEPNEPILPKANNPSIPASEAQIAAMEASIEQRVPTRKQWCGDVVRCRAKDPSIGRTVATDAAGTEGHCEPARSPGQTCWALGAAAWRSDQQDPAHLDERLNDQMQKIEALLNKLPRQEWQKKPGTLPGQRILLSRSLHRILAHISEDRGSNVPGPRALVCSSCPIQQD